MTSGRRYSQRRAGREAGTPASLADEHLWWIQFPWSKEEPTKEQLTRRLLDPNVDIEAMHDYVTALYQAVRCRNLGAIEALVEAGADLSQGFQALIQRGDQRSAIKSYLERERARRSVEIPQPQEGDAAPPAPITAVMEAATSTAVTETRPNGAAAATVSTDPIAVGFISYLGDKKLLIVGDSVGQDLVRAGRFSEPHFLVPPPPAPSRRNSCSLRLRRVSFLPNAASTRPSTVHCPVGRATSSGARSRCVTVGRGPPS